MRKKSLILLPLLLLLLIGGCTKNKETQQLKDKVHMDLEKVVYEIAEAAQFGSMFEVDDNYLISNYAFDDQHEIEVNGLFGSVLDSNRILVFHVNTEEEKQRVFEFIEYIKGAIINNYPSEMKDEKEMIAQGKTLDEGTYILFISGENAQKGMDHFERLCN